MPELSDEQVRINLLNIRNDALADAFDKEERASLDAAIERFNLPKFKKGDTVNSSAGRFVVVTGEIVKVEQVYLYTVRGKWPANPLPRFMEHELVKEVPHDDGA